jgi:pimeloyl-ACP methyl ester carboxylesterase
MVLLHGFTDTWRTWTPVLPALEAHHAVFAPSLPGHYGGEAIPPGEHVTVQESLDMLERQLDAQGIGKAHLVGNSLGGWGALELAARGRALSVVGICPAGGWEIGSKEDRAVLRYFRATERRLHATMPLLPRIARTPALRRVAFRDLMARPGNVDADAAMAFFTGAANCTIFDDAIAQAEAGEAFGDLAPIDCPIRILYGTRDRIIRWPSHYTRMKKLLPDAEYLPLHGLGHIAMWDDPVLVARRVLEVSSPESAKIASPEKAVGGNRQATGSV